MNASFAILGAVFGAIFGGAVMAMLTANKIRLVVERAQSQVNQAREQLRDALKEHDTAWEKRLDWQRHEQHQIVDQAVGVTTELREMLQSSNARADALATQMVTFTARRVDAAQPVHDGTAEKTVNDADAEFVEGMSQADVRAALRSGELISG